MVSGLREASGGGCRHGGEGGKVRQRERRWLGGGRQLGEGPTAGSSGFQRTAVWSLWVARPAAPMPGAAGEASDGRGSPGFPEPGLHTIIPNLACADIEMSQDTVNTTDGGLTRSGLTRADWDALLAEDVSYLDPEDVAAKQDYPSDPEEFAEQSLNTKELVLSISKSIVSLVSSVDGKILLACTGTVVDHVASATWILTSASLVRKPGSDCDAYQEGEVKIEVFLHNKSAIDGCIAMCNLQYNIAIITVDSLDLPMMALNDPPGCYSMLACPVIAIGRDSKSLRVKHGDMTRERSKLDCSELLACTCPVSKIFIGGLIMDFERRIVGISFFGKDTTPVLPIEIAARCLQHFKCFGTLEQPCLCIRVRALHSMDLEVLDKMRKICPDLSCGTGIVVDQIPEALSMNCGGIEVGDIICSIDGVALHSVAQFTAILLDGMVVAMSPKNKGILQGSVRRPGDETKLVAMLNMRENPLVDCNNFFCNRWMLP